MDNFVDFEKWKIPLKIEYTKNKGRYVIATDDYKKDSRIVAFKSYSTGIIDSYKKKICSVCLSINNDGFYDLTCKSCNSVYYCSKSCLMYSQRKLNHDMICPLLRKLSTFKTDIHSKIPLPSDIEEYEKEIKEKEKDIISEEKIVEDKRNDELIKDETNEEMNKIDDQLSNNDVSEEDNKKKKDKNKKKDKKKSKERKSKKDKKENEEEFNEINGKLKKEKSKHKHKREKETNSQKQNETIHDENNEDIDSKENKDKYDIVTNTIPYSGTFEDMMNLQSHYNEWTNDMKMDWQKNINFFKKMLQDSKEVNEYMMNAVKEFVYRKKNIVNDTDIENFNTDIEIENFILSFASLSSYLSVCFIFNHSCRNNCYPVQYKNHIYFYASKNIKKGDEINFSYIETEGVSLKDRQAHLFADYYFKCQCDLCLEEENKALSLLFSKRLSKIK
ncbi:SET domain-containing protein [Neocallimastix californiae]|uniref:SET domain-containing protein n=1 Tax=Neocallimastix californiae TaxID=1754190 RepID=A0A1Y1ZMA4_9FUNG|nr:SET domain-containing protein [Neocallimastix californiae]|eukprot:ORY11383.1 SET domain-containing protein [Neocallimastix californiae]